MDSKALEDRSAPCGRDMDVTNRVRHEGAQAKGYDDMGDSRSAYT